MLNIKIISIGKIKEKYLNEGIHYYTKELSKHINLSLVELKDEPTKENASDLEIKEVLDKEAERILKYIDNNDYIVSLCIEGQNVSTHKFTNLLTQDSFSNKTVTFIIGGSLGISEKIKNISDLRLSFSKMTFPHQLMRLILLEQLYRNILLTKE